MALSKEREGRITASCFAAAMGIDKNRSRNKWWRSAKGLEIEDDNYAMAWGREHEEEAVFDYELEYGLLFHTGDNQKFTISREIDWIGCTCDGVDPSEGYPVEFKCPQNMYDEVPAHYIPQVMGQMYILEKSVARFVAWTPDDMRVWEIERSDEYIEVMLEHLKAAYKLMQSDKEPPRIKSKKAIMDSLPKVKITEITKSYEF